MAPRSPRHRRARATKARSRATHARRACRRHQTHGRLRLGVAQKIDRAAIEDLFSLNFIKGGHYAVLVGPNGVGKTMILKNVAQHALSLGHSVRFATASDMLAELSAQESGAGLARRLRRHTLPQLLCVDEVGYLSYNSRYADLLFEVVTRRYDVGKPLLLSTNKGFSEWGAVFPQRPAWSPSSIA
ncbi:MAG: ATP-binding protein [Polyangiaceae bacterium]